MTTHADRRSPGTNRVPFDAMVEVGGALGPTFEAQAVNLSEAGMQLRTAYLPEIGQELHCRFDAGSADHIMVTGEVLWREDFGHGGEFGIRFREIDPDMAGALERICGFTDPAHGIGSRVRLHIDGLASPMRARIRDVRGASIVAYSELGFLQMGRSVELEDASTGERRPAHVNQVEVELDGSSRVPQLVVSMKYDDLNRGEPMMMNESTHAADPHGEVVMPDGDEHNEMIDERAHVDTMHSADRAEEELVDEQDKNAVDKMRGAFSRASGKVTPAVIRMAARTKTVLALLWAKRKQSTDARRVTAPPPQGVLHSGRGKVTRDSMADELSMGERAKETLTKHKTKVAAGVIVLGIGIVGVAAFGHDEPKKDLANNAPVVAPEVNTKADPAAPIVAENPSIPAPLGATIEPTTPVVATLEAEHTSTGGKARPFVNGRVTHPKVIRIKMDGPIENIQGSPQPSGFAVSIPGRRSLDGSGGLAGKDSRIERVKLNGDAAGTELSMTFKDGVPNYQVRARGDVLEIALEQAKTKHPRAKHGGRSKKGHKH